MKNLYEKSKDRDDVQFLGLALEGESDLGKLKTTIEKNSIPWSNYWIDRKDNKIHNAIIQKLKIKAYPTYLIIDKEGKIVARGESGGLKYEEMEKVFLELIDND